MKQLVSLINNMKLKYKLMMFYVVVVMIPVLIVGIILISYFRNAALDRAIDQASNNVEKIKSQMSSKLRVPTDISNLLFFDDALEVLVNTKYPNILELTKAYMDYTDFKEYMLQYREIANIRFFIDNPTLVNNLAITPLTSETEERPWFKKVMETKGIYWLYIDDKEEFLSTTKGSINKLSLIRQVSYPEYNSTGVIMVQVNQNELNNMLSQEPFETIITDEQGYIVAAKNPQLVGTTLASFDIGVNLESQTDKVIQTQVKGEDSYVILDEMSPELSISKLKIISVFETKSILSGANKVSVLGLLIISGVLLVALVMVYIISLLTTNRLLRLSRQLNQVALGNLNIVSHIDGTDEIGQLSRQFNYMVSSINQLISQVIESNEKNSRLEIAQREIKLKMMASQIHPHFLFNALESIRMNAHLKGEKEIANIVRLLGKLMRKNLEVGRERAPLKEEIEMIRSYLEIQKFRYEDRLMYEINFDAKAAEVLIPPLIIQPLVENSVVHGLENKEGTVQVYVSVTMQENEIQVNVSDDGVGMSSQRLAEILEVITKAEEEQRSRIGMRNVHQRLVLYYGEQHGLKIASEEGRGTEISFSIPSDSDYKQ
ncbi:two-component system sensor histidine kinase YesM [Paenibacillus sp. PastF-1]|nr:two-component system sensor histidine kinase YesM [Paenibacillus sp. PastF-2]MDF9849710.1 two-component system sensor histidine kinase YesM [Paenibacillus sp. PastM-2]MDF9856373.1 two-component system sensor histidine kinase YesM [Paenibacillus sp. PastF-1]MDH6481644.1 two-component system sensor histidine kinase YesM [Paenibacillus sp. PastH-2]MDH6508926.1 two-component system sensor histidine kinase YesM [Paenibacillus sp. PastM-3]